ncbi:hypothetical protein ACIBQX_23960 [Nonomuraea sp. NPDC049714]|uniref:hypothetical protein n=1 Tax=Nonomuraea sp. NPDC049714 TaxID=3364357 RepID=UPI0037AE4BD1
MENEDSMRKNMTTAAVVTAALMAALAGGTASATTTGSLRPAAAQQEAVPSRIAVHFDLAKGQTPENIALSPDGTAYVTFAAARQVAMVTRKGTTRILATMPAPMDGGVDTPVLKFALTTGIVRTDDGTLYFLYASGAAETTGLYRLREGGTPTRVAALPATGLPNGLALDERSKTFYITDSALGTISTVRLGDHRASVWSSAPQLASTGFIGVNGVKVRDGAVWASNLDKGTLLRIPLRHGRPGPIKVMAEGLAGIDDFAFAGSGDDRVIATLHGISSVVRVGPKGKVTTLLTASDGLQNPTSVAVRGRTLHVLSAAFTTATDPNLLLATLPRH